MVGCEAIWCQLGHLSMWGSCESFQKAVNATTLEASAKKAKKKKVRKSRLEHLNFIWGKADAL